MFNIALGAFLLLSPILFLPLSVPAIATLQFHQFGYFSNSINLVQLQIFMYGIVVLFAVAMFYKQKRFFYDKYLSIIIFICMFSVYLHPKTLKFFPIIFLGFLLYYLVSVCASVKNLRPFFKIIAFVSFLNVVFSIVQLLNIHFILFKDHGEIIGLMGYKTQLGIYQALALPICYVLNPWLTIVPFIGLLLSKSATAMVAGIIGMGYLLKKRGLCIQSIPIWLSIFTISGIYLYKHSYQLSIRFPVWIEAIKGSINHLFTGNGIGIFNYIIVRPTQYSLQYSDPYNIYLEIFHALGIFGLIAFVLFLRSKFDRFGQGSMEKALSASCLILIVAGLGYSFMDYPRLAGTAIVLFGLLTAVKQESKLKG